MDNLNQQITDIKLKHMIGYWLVKLLRFVSWLYVIAWLGLLGCLLHDTIVKNYKTVLGDVVLLVTLAMPVIGTVVARINKKFVHYLWSLVNLVYIIVLWLIYHEGYAGSYGELLVFLMGVTLICFVGNQVIYGTSQFYSAILLTKNTKIIPAIVVFVKMRAVVIAVLVAVVGVAAASLFMVKANPKQIAVLQDTVASKKVVKVAASFDCDKATTRAESLICEPDNTSLREADLRMADLFNKISGGTKNQKAYWIEESQKNWLQARQQCEDKWCLEDLYKARMDEMEKGIVVNPIPRERLPWRVTLPNGQVGLFVLEEYNLGNVDNGDGVNRQEKLIYRRDGVDQVLWEEQNVYYDDERMGDHNRILRGVSVIAFNNKQVVVRLDERVSENYPPDEREYGCSYRYYSLLENGSLAFQGSKEMFEDEDIAQTNYGTITPALLENSPALSVVDYYLGEASYSFSPKNLRRNFRFRFDGQPWEEVLPEPQTWLDKPDAAARYIKLYADISKSIESHMPSGECRESGIDWAQASAGLYVWMDIIDEAHERGVAYTDATVIVSMLIGSNARPVLTNSQIELLRALGHIRKKIEESKNWKEQMINLYNTEKESDNLHELGSMMAKEFPAIRIGCAAQFSTKYGFDFDDWLYTFWVRRQLDGTYDIATKIIDYSTGSLQTKEE